MARGKILYFNQSRGYGFIETESGAEPAKGRSIYVHYSQVAGHAPREGDAVEYEVREGSHGLEAFNVIRMS